MCAALGATGCGSKKNGADASDVCPPPADAANGTDDDAPADTPPGNVAGDYIVTITNVANTCSTLTGWVEGGMTPDVHYDIQQDGSNVTGQAQGDAALNFVVLTGSNDFSGTVNGSSFKLTDVGPNVTKAGSCSYTVNAIVSGTLDGDSITGTVTYRPVLNADPSCNSDCEPFACEVDQEFAGTRAPD